jgi:hypothetical protein
MVTREGSAEDEHAVIIPHPKPRLWRDLYRSYQGRILSVVVTKNGSVKDHVLSNRRIKGSCICDTAPRLMNPCALTAEAGFIYVNVTLA